MSYALIALGSNHQPVEHLRRAALGLRELGQILAASRVYQAAAQGQASAPPYWNAVLSLETELDVLALYAALKALEQASGRNRPSLLVSLDLDLLLYDELVRDAKPILPHPDLLSKRYVALPAAEVASDRLHPLSRQSLQAIAESLTQPVLTPILTFHLL
ncbi:MAG: 2-amino-4-hydroxy-6-hydroxymethyldihydropteridine diphosphokinase [Anaerolineae bacterium]|nr:2-amino-4-hydroxy-6-hydroxymethyldihydropteridine diphosphokinase [Anaerolineae bacterium]MDW8171262.1 2-amino-4-hydroxy-6-hydroxymethyldihydropteridine diphosphokinase [Anaerolineae bacterium]